MEKLDLSERSEVLNGVSKLLREKNKIWGNSSHRRWGRS
jgi:hypothetical protein